MINYSDFFIAIYTNQCKSYCDQQFFRNLFQSDIGDAQVHIVDNSIDGEYAENLKNLIYPLSNNCSITHIAVSRDDVNTLFLRNVTESVSFLRNVFLGTLCKYFITLESDVIPPQNWLQSFNDVIDCADIIGGIYYTGMHPPDMFIAPDKFVYTDLVLSGCTLYKRHIIEKFPFRWDANLIACFPDGWMSADARNAGYKLADYSAIKCQHLHTAEGSRGLDKLR
jgi:hypothetical protein